jgi:hypothetical protein
VRNLLRSMSMAATGSSLGEAHGQPTVPAAAVRVNESAWCAVDASVAEDIPRKEHNARRPEITALDESEVAQNSYVRENRRARRGQMPWQDEVRNSLQAVGP